MRSMSWVLGGADTGWFVSRSIEGEGPLDTGLGGACLGVVSLATGLLGTVVDNGYVSGCQGNGIIN